MDDEVNVFGGEPIGLFTSKDMNSVNEENTISCMFELVVLLLPGHIWGSIGVHHL